jgi:hypothetical protein
MSSCCHLLSLPDQLECDCSHHLRCGSGPHLPARPTPQWHAWCAAKPSALPSLLLLTLDMRCHFQVQHHVQDARHDTKHRNQPSRILLWAPARICKLFRVYIIQRGRCQHTVFACLINRLLACHLDRVSLHCRRHRQQGPGPHSAASQPDERHRCLKSTRLC